MGKYNRYKNRIEMWLSSENGKRILNFVYSWGASIVIIGALFKILHLPYGSQILAVAMVTEALVFFISAFDKPLNEYHWEEVFPVLKSKNPLDRPDFGAGEGHGVVFADGTHPAGGTVVIGNIGEGQVTTGSSVGGGILYATAGQGRPEQPSPQHLVDAGLATMGLNVSEKDAEMLAESIKKLNNAAEQISKMADLTEATQSYIQQISTVSENLGKLNEVTSSLGNVSETLAESSKAIMGEEVNEEGISNGYVEQMKKLNGQVSEMTRFYETQLTGLRSQMETIQHINAGLNRIRDLYDTSVVDSAAFRNENERMAQLLGQLNQVYSRLLQAMTVNMPGGGGAVGYPQQGFYQQPPYQAPYQSGGGYR